MVPVTFILNLTVRYATARFNPAPQTVDWYLTLLHGHALARSADFKRGRDFERAGAAQQLVEELKTLVTMYLGTGVLAPDMTFASKCPHGDPTSLFSAGR
jgi:hypothetical protein